ncbi:hypothetical protein CAP35_13920 [Chitinophagaceae bacterium IBVUCB1]|nr:hypothetical protein CAP35_13920 [Chitinophagaceae bacterium IBVUCB1]
MEKGTRTTIGQLLDGDRFCFATDKDKIVWQKMPLLSGKGHSWKYKGKIFYADIEVRTDAGTKRYCKHTTQVVFLRHTVEQTDKQPVGGLAG